MSETERKEALDYWAAVGLVDVVDSSGSHHIGTIVDTHDGFIVLLDLYDKRCWINASEISSIRELDLERGAASKTPEEEDRRDKEQRTLNEMMGGG